MTANLPIDHSDAPPIRWWSVLEGSPPRGMDLGLLDQPQLGLRITWERRRLESWADPSRPPPVAAGSLATRSSSDLRAPSVGAPRPAGVERRTRPEGIHGTLPTWPRGPMAVRQWILRLGGQPLADAGREDHLWLVAHPDILVPLRLAPWIRHVEACSVGDLVRALTTAVALGEAQWIGGAPQDARQTAPSRIR